jgi:hypothetical protein
VKFAESGKMQRTSRLGTPTAPLPCQKVFRHAIFLYIIPMIEKKWKMHPSILPDSPTIIKNDYQRQVTLSHRNSALMVSNEKDIFSMRATNISTLLGILLFDMDGTLINSTNAIVKFWER